MASELACTYAALILHDDDIQITADKITALVKAAGVDVEAFWPVLYAKALSGRNVGDLLANIGAAGPAPAAAAAAPAAAAAAGGAKEEKKEEKKKEEKAESEEGDMGFGLFD